MISANTVFAPSIELGPIPRDARRTDDQAEPEDRAKKQRRVKRGKRGLKRCWNCLEGGHTAANCPEERIHINFAARKPRGRTRAKAKKGSQSTETDTKKRRAKKKTTPSKGWKGHRALICLDNNYLPSNSRSNSWYRHWEVRLPADADFPGFTFFPPSERPELRLQLVQPAHRQPQCSTPDFEFIHPDFEFMDEGELALIDQWTKRSAAIRRHGENQNGDGHLSRGEIA